MTAPRLVGKNTGVGFKERVGAIRADRKAFAVELAKFRAKLDVHEHKFEQAKDDATFYGELEQLGDTLDDLDELLFCLINKGELELLLDPPTVPK